MNLSLQYTNSPNVGYGRMGISLAQALEAKGVKLYRGHGPDDERPSRKTHAVSFLGVPAHTRGFWDGQHLSIFTMWEATKLPVTFTENLHVFDQVIVPSWQNRELFSGFHDNVAYCPLGIDPARWHYQSRRPHDATFTFLCGGAGPRKGTDLAFTAFDRVFGKDWERLTPSPLLVMKNPRNESFPQRGWLSVIPGHISEADEVELYAQAHCYLQPSRGEGFGLQPLQAMAQGCPTILTDAHGHESFAHLGIGISATMTKAAAFLFGEAGDWWEPSLDELCEAMWGVYQDYAVQVERAKESAVHIAKHWAWANTAEKFITILGDHLTLPYEGDGTWRNPIQKVYRVRTFGDHLFDVGGEMYQFIAGVDRWVPADIKRQMFERHILDPECCRPEDDHGLSVEQATQLDDPLAPHHWCKTCGQHLNAGPTRADAIEASFL